MTVCLTMIVRCEEAILRGTLEQVRPLIDRWAILDTGSTDHTPDIVEQVLGEIPGRLRRSVWTDFGHARTRAFDEARAECEGQGWALIIDADSTVIHSGREALVAELNADSHDVELRHGGASFWMPCVLSLSHPWRWHGPVHEALIGEPYAVPGDPVKSLRIEPRSGGASYRDPEKYLKHAEILAKACANDPEWAPRWWFYRAQSLRDAGDDLGAVTAYVARGSMVEGWVQERYVAWLQAGDAHRRLSSPLGSQLECWYAAIECDPTRPEALLRAAAATRDVGLFRASWLAAREALAVTAKEGPHGLFAETEAWGWRLWFEVAVSAWWADERQVGLEASVRVLREDSGAPENVKATVRANLAWYA